jgi:hypothetical protein
MIEFKTNSLNVVIKMAISIDSLYVIKDDSLRMIVAAVVYDFMRSFCPLAGIGCPTIIEADVVNDSSIGCKIEFRITLHIQHRSLHFGG